MKIKTITKIQHDEYVYNIGVENNHNYFANSILIHNCYMSSTQDEPHYENIIEKTRTFFDAIPKEQLPFQVALGGGEPTSHPDFCELLRVFKEEYDICPNYTTNGIFAKKFNQHTTDILEATSKYCGGVAVSCHPHLQDEWVIATHLLCDYLVRVNFHIIISDKESIDYFAAIYKEWNDKIDYFVLLPYGAQGRAEPKEIDWEYLVEKLPIDQSKIAFGANFYPYLLKGGHNIKVSLYEPELMSKFIDLKDMKVYPSSFNLI